MSDTPRTDAIAHRGFHADVLIAKAIDLCRELERENAALREQLKNVTVELKVTKVNALADKERLDSRTILLTENGERVHHVEVNLRAAIDAGRKESQP